MLKRTVSGFRALRQWAPRGSRRKLYHVEQSRGIGVEKLLMIPFKSVTEKESPLRILEKVMRPENVKEVKPLVKHPGSLSNELYVKELPQQLREALRSSSDIHRRLEILLTYKDPLKVFYLSLEKIVRMDFGVDELKELVTQGLIGQEMVVSLTKYLLFHRRYDQVAEVYCHLLLGSFHDLQLTQKMNDTLFTTLEADHDVEFGFYETMKHIYAKVEHDVKLYKFVFSNITNNANTLIVRGFKHPMFLDLLRVVQLEAYAQSCSDVSILPQEYWSTDFDFVNLALALRLIQAGKHIEALDNLEDRGILAKDGVFYRLVHQAKRDSTLTTQEIAQMALQYFKRHPQIRMGRMDESMWGKVTTSQNFYKKSIANVADQELKMELKSLYLSKLIRQKKLGIARAWIHQNIEDVNLFNLTTVTTLIHLTRDRELLHRILTVVTPLRRQILFDLVYLRYITSFKERTPPEMKLRGFEWVLECYGYRLTDKNFRQMQHLLCSLPEKLRVDVLLKVQGPSCQSYIELIKRCKSVETVVALLVNKRVFKTRAELIHLSKVLVSSLSTSQIVDVLCELQEVSPPLYHSLNQKITLSLISRKKWDTCYKILKECPEKKSSSLLDEALVLDDPQNVCSLLEGITDESKRRELTTMKQVMETPMGRAPCSLTKGVKRVLEENKRNKALSVLVLRRTVKEIRIRHGQVRRTQRLQWALSQCLRYGVPRETIQSMIS